MNSPLLPVAVSLIAGIVAARYAPGDIVWYVAAMLACLAVASWLLWRRLAAVMLLGMLTGIAVEQVDSYLNHSDTRVSPGVELQCA